MRFYVLLREISINIPKCRNVLVGPVGAPQLLCAG